MTIRLRAPARPSEGLGHLGVRPVALRGGKTPVCAGALVFCALLRAPVCAQEPSVTASAESLPVGGIVLAREGEVYRPCTDAKPCGQGSLRGVWWELPAAQTLATEYRASKEHRLLSSDLQLKVTLLEERLAIWQDLSNKKDIALTVMSQEVEAANARRKEADERAARADRTNLWWFFGGMAVVAISVGLGAAL